MTMPTLATALQSLTLAGIAMLVYLLRDGFFSYAKEKGKNLATKQDIGDITRQVENIKTELAKLDAVDRQKRQLKYDACLDALAVIDAHLSHIFQSQSPQPTKQPTRAKASRAVHNKLVLACDDTRIVTLYMEILCGAPEGTASRPPTDLLNEFRNLARVELGFGSELDLDRDRAWISVAIGDPANPEANDC